MNFDNIDIKNIYKTWNITLEMLNDRKYDVPNKYNITLEEFTILYNTNNLYIHIPKTDVKNDICVFFSLIEKAISKKLFNILIDELFEKYTPNTHIILVMKKKINNIIIKELQNEKNKNVQIYLSNKLYYNITKHYLVPEHIPLNKKEKTDMMEKYNVTENQIPKILEKDPITCYYGMKNGDVCKIIRKNKYVGTEISYRIVVSKDSL
tara:strand:- start:48 stop:671 length:624 start_codon:yes stop_codon:yes gene_type:complete